MLKIKVAITSPGQPFGPYFVDVAVPKTGGGYWLFQFEKLKFGQAVSLLADYFQAFEKDPKKIEDFHFQKINVHKSIQELPFART